ncbi:5'-nucleotidase domain-containing protein 1 [Teleopsis dalmanni]|uniref:5'-nucleotidase domain-containing protein 1 n=1 Tax=Teleopsis dalmanni TaxID=139649 RepID=UPI0018CF0F4B|nr:5'-nucleotidase domain-containing protein 1 [Teleopsis dalmanni]
MFTNIINKSILSHYKQNQNLCAGLRNFAPEYRTTLAPHTCRNFCALFSSHGKPIRLVNKNNNSKNQYYKYSNSAGMKDYKQFCFNDYDVIGFDLDATLLRYNLSEMLPLEYECLRHFLVDVKKYPKILLKCKLNCEFLQKGLILDGERGNVLKLGQETEILRATHGTKLLTEEEIINIYGEKRQWSVATEFFQDIVTNWNGPLTKQFRMLPDCFDTPAAMLFAQIIDFLDDEAKTENKCPPDVYNIWPDVRESLMHTFARENFSNGQSLYFNALRAEPERYILHTSDKVLQWLKTLRASGKAVFLITGSNIDFANFTASYALGNDWQKLFDSVVCYARKPIFFTSERPYLKVKDLDEVAGSEISTDAEISLNTVYSQGNWLQLKAALAKKLCKSPDEVRCLYMGDNFAQDVYAPTAIKSCNIDTIGLSEELLVEDNYTSWNYEYSNVLQSAFWGSYFCTDKPTYWSSIIKKYAKLCVPLIDTIADSDLNRVFCSYNTDGYFPEPPLTLEKQVK